MSTSGPTTFNPLAVDRPSLNTPLARILAERIRLNGPIPFRDWMDACLYEPECGYYRRGRPTVGREGDFLTSPEVHPLFGAAIGHLAAEIYQRLGRPASFRIAEVGPGSGALAEALLRHMLRQLRARDRALTASLIYTLVERDPRTAAAQRARIAPLADIETVTDLADLESPCQLIVANELLDALPAHLLRWHDGRWRERYVDYAAEPGFFAVDGELSDPRLLDPLRGLSPVDGQIVEVAPERSDVVSALARSLADRGALLLFDYGYRRERLYAPWRRDGTLMTFRRHVPGDDPLAYPGEQDITAHIDIDQVGEAAAAAGLRPLSPLSQAEWLHQIGAAALPAAADAGGDTNAYLAARRAVETLTDPAGLGRIAVMGFTRGELAPLPGWKDA